MAKRLCLILIILNTVVSITIAQDSISPPTNKIIDSSSKIKVSTISKRVEGKTNIPGNVNIISDGVKLIKNKVLNLKRDSLKNDNRLIKFFKNLVGVEDLTIKKDSAKKNGFLKVISHGNIYAQYDYGYHPYFITSETPSGFFSSGGDANINILKLPFNVNYYYNQNGNVNGLNNYLKVSFDAAQYKKNLANKLNDKLKEKTKELKNLQDQKQEISQKLYYYKSLKANKTLNVNPNISQIFGNNLNANSDYKNKLNIEDSLEGENSLDGLQNINTESLKGKLTDTLINNKATDSLKDLANNILDVKLKIKADSNNKLNINDSLKGINNLESLKNINTESLKEKLTDKLNNNKYSDSLKNLANNVLKFDGKIGTDSLNEKIQKYTNLLNSLTEKIAKLEKIIKIIKNPEASIKDKLETKNFLLPVFEKINKLELGLCYPSYSTFLINGIGVMGINLESQSKNLYFAIIHGVSKDTRYYSNSSQYFLQKITDFFDYNNLSYGNRITAAKIGYGKKEKSHIYFGILYGYGAEAQYYFDSIEDRSYARKERNYVMEVDARIALKRNNIIDIIYGKSSISSEDSANNTGISGLFDFDKRSNALLVKYTTQISKTKTKLMLTSRLVDPYFKSFGVGYMKSNIFSYEIRVDQQISKKIKATCFYRSNEDNLVRLSLAKSSYKSIGTTLSCRLSRNISIKGTYNPIFQKVQIEGTKDLKFNSYIASGVLTISGGKREFKTINNIVFNYYNYYDGISVNDYKSALINSGIIFKSAYAD